MLFWLAKELVCGGFYFLVFGYGEVSRYLLILAAAVAGDAFNDGLVLFTLCLWAEFIRCCWFNRFLTSVPRRCGEYFVLVIAC